MKININNLFCCRTTQAIDALNLCYGIGKVFLLKINSRPQGQVEEQLPDPWSQYVSTTFETTDSSRPSPDDSPSTSRSLIRSLEGPESVESGLNLPYHPLSPETEAQQLVCILFMFFSEIFDCTYLIERGIVRERNSSRISIE